VKGVIVLFTAITLSVLCALPVLAQGLGISPPSVEFDAPADGSTEVEFLVYDFTGDLEISLEDIPLRVEPTTVSVTAEEQGSEVVLIFYGDESLGSQVFTGKIRFLAMTGDTVAMGIKVKATINHIAAGQPLPETTPPETTPNTPPAGESASPTPPAPSSGAAQLPIIPLAGIAAGAAVVITLIVVLARRRY